MTTLLIVDDDQGQLRQLARALSMRRRDLTVLTACDGLEAIEVLEVGPIDVVLTDLQMPEMNGFDLLAWLRQNQPHVPVYSMTAFPAEVTDRLTVLGSLECFTKPLDIAVVLERVSKVLAEGARGHVRDIGLPAFLQLLEMEQKTCTLSVVSGDRVGYLYLERGALVDARALNVQGLDATWAILSWPEPAITIQSPVANVRRTIELPTSFVIMEAMRRADESGRNGFADDGRTTEPLPRATATPSSPFSSPFLRTPTPTPTPAVRPSSRPRSSSAPLSRFPVYLPADATAIALVESSTGRVRAAAGSLKGLDAHAALTAALFAAQRNVVEKLDEEVQEIVITTTHAWTLVRPVRVDPSSLVMLVFDPSRANLVYERRELTSFVDELEAWCARMI